MDSVIIHGTRLEVRHIPGQTGRSPLVFLHEGLGSVSMWTQRGRNWTKELCNATGRSGWVYSRRGYGHSDPVPDVRGTPQVGEFWHTGRHEPDYMHREALDVLPALLETLGIDAPVLVGHSDGATIALLYASRHPVTACVVMAPHVFVEEVSIRSIKQARSVYMQPGEQGLRSRLARHHKNVDNAFWQWNDIWLDPAFLNFDIRSECRNIRAPVLAIQGANDEYGTLQQIWDVQPKDAAAHTLVLSACGHSPHRDQPDAVLAAIGTFLSELP
ncbi:alpha/beta fold hydrolase [Hydrogenophaga luteola]|uniref:Alpha/beta fold hydrolase n=1 Tax=Hydrogenophaga luteola TaxID=1591122 RepID=A0ABV7W6A1_9BURK